MLPKRAIVPLFFGAVAVALLSLWEESMCVIGDVDSPMSNSPTRNINRQQQQKTYLATVVPESTSGPEESQTPPTVCTGSPQERRALVDDEFATSEDWRRMTKCTLDRYSKLHGHFSLHISKAGGTSFCEALKSKNQQCRRLPPRSQYNGTNYNYNCYVSQNKVLPDGPAWKQQRFNLGPRWTRQAVQKKMKLDSWMGGYVEDNSIPCSVIENHFETADNMVVFSENHLVSGDTCENGMVNSIVIREPMKRLLSHYNDIYLWCLKYKDNPLCLKMLLGGDLSDGVRVYDTMFMAESFDFISDNIYARSLNSNQIYYAPLGFEGMDSDDVLRSALKSLEKFDWVVVIGSGNKMESENNDLILKEGLGLGIGMPHSNTVGTKKSASNTTKLPSALSPQGKVFLRKLNDLDYRIWAEAQRLNQLDVASIKLMRKHGSDIFAEYEASKRKNEGDYCCGYVCKTPDAKKSK
eukprot:scaffold22585_cov149-Cylindrotheca_fusiformis.AAC.3